VISRTILIHAVLVQINKLNQREGNKLFDWIKNRNKDLDSIEFHPDKIIRKFRYSSPNKKQPNERKLGHMFKAQTQKLVTISFCKNPRLVQKDGSTHCYLQNCDVALLYSFVKTQDMNLLSILLTLKIECGRLVQRT
jgi:hypothetical protein